MPASCPFHHVHSPLVYSLFPTTSYPQLLLLLYSPPICPLTFPHLLLPTLSVHSLLNISASSPLLSTSSYPLLPTPHFSLPFLLPLVHLHCSYLLPFCFFLVAIPIRLLSSCCRPSVVLPFVILYIATYPCSFLSLLCSTPPVPPPSCSSTSFLLTPSPLFFLLFGVNLQ